MFNDVFNENKRKLIILLSIFLIASLAISMIETVNAADITIDPNTPGGLNQAIDTAKNGDTILLKNGVYKGKNNTNINITKDINIKGLGSNVVLDGERKNQIMEINKKM